MNEPIDAVPAHNIGGYVPMVDGPEKVSGRAKYTADIVAAGHAGRPHLPQPLCARRDPRRRRLRGAEAARRARRSSPAPTATRPSACCRSRAASIRWRATRCAIAASRWRPWRPSTTRPRAKALRLIKMKVRELPAYYTAKAALAPGAVAAAREEARQPRARRAVRARQRRRRASPRPIWCARRTYNCAEVCQNQMEMHAAVADYDAVRDRMTVHASTQVPYYVHLMLAQILGMDMSRIRVVKPHRRRRLRLPHRDAQRRADRRAAGAQGRRHRAHGDQRARRPSSPIAAGPRPTSAEDRPAQGRPHHRGRMRMRSSAAARIPATAW